MLLVVLPLLPVIWSVLPTIVIGDGAVWPAIVTLLMFLMSSAVAPSLIVAADVEDDRAPAGGSALSYRP